jgi:hypothetical protein
VKGEITVTVKETYQEKHPEAEQEITIAERDAYLSKVEALLRAWRVAFDTWNTEASKLELPDRTIYETQLEVLAVKLEIAHRRLQNLRLAGQEEWVERRAELATALTGLDEEFNRIKETAPKTGTDVLSWATGIADEHKLESIGWAQGMATEDPVESIGWAQGLAEEDPVDSMGWAEGYDQKKRKQ